MMTTTVGILWWEFNRHDLCSTEWIPVRTRTEFKPSGHLPGITVRSEITRTNTTVLMEKIELFFTYKRVSLA